MATTKIEQGRPAPEKPSFPQNSLETEASNPKLVSPHQALIDSWADLSTWIQRRNRNRQVEYKRAAFEKLIQSLPK